MNPLDYTEFTTRVFGLNIPFDLRQTKLHSVYPQDSEWFKRCVDALFAIEVDFVQSLIVDLGHNNIQGAFAEFGIFQGHWIQRLFDLTEAAKLNEREIWGFDSFKGLSLPHPEYDSPFWKEGAYAASREEVEKYLQTSKRRRIKLVEGYFSESLLGDTAKSLGQVAFARIDCDIYEPAKDCLTFLSNRLADGSVLVFDDWTHNISLGEGRAFAEWVPTVPHLRFEFLSLGPWDHLYIRVRHK